MILSSLCAFVGGTSRNLGFWALQINRILLLGAMVATFVLGSYVWFDSLDVRMNYSGRWASWQDQLKEGVQAAGQCCGYTDSRDNPVFTTACSPEVIRLGLLPGCSEKLFTFINHYLQIIYSAMFVYVFLGVAALLATLIFIHSLHIQIRYEKSQARICIHNSLPIPPSRDSQRLSSHPISSRHVSVIYNRESSAF
ncbi:hypothetical protein DSO57_1017807 [Entomophthora muscae]|nr:hypothetical protein DSO57_1017807 [Entomophthora muscae]